MRIYVPTKVHNVHRFLGLVNYYRDTLRYCAHTLSPLTKICLTKVNFKWTGVYNNAFISMKNIVGHDVLLYFYNFSEIFIIHTDTSKTQLGGVIGQNGNPIAFYSRKLTPAQINYMTT